MPIKINHYAKIVKTNVKTSIEAGCIELFIGIICAVFAYVTYNKFLLIFVSTAVLAAVCFVLTIINIYFVIQHILEQIQSRDMPENTTRDK